MPLLHIYYIKNINDTRGNLKPFIYENRQEIRGKFANCWHGNNTLLIDRRALAQ